jgi:hypothetical protein
MMVYVSVETRAREHHCHIWFGNQEKLAVAEHSIKLCTRFLLSNTKKSRHMNRIIREVIEIKLCPKNVNIDDEFSLSKSWKRLVYTQKEQKKVLCKNKVHTSFCRPHQNTESFDLKLADVGNPLICHLGRHLCLSWAVEVTHS